MSKHTPGPWRAQDCYVFAENDQMMVCEMRGWGRLTGTGGGFALSEGEALAIQDANARLIAAAPDLRESAYGLMMLAFQSDRYANDTEYRDAANAVFAAIQKADGRTGAGRPTTTSTMEQP